MVWLVKTEIKDSGVHGKGIFAAEFIPKGTKVWVYSDDWRAYTQTKMEQISEQDPERMKKILWGGYHHDPTGVFVHYQDGMEYMNHSTKDNIGGLDDDSHSMWGEKVEDEESFALKEIQCGEEFFEDYSLYNCHRVAWLAELYQKHCPKRHEFELSIARHYKADSPAYSSLDERIILDLLDKIDSLKAGSGYVPPRLRALYVPPS
jgi:hypothetical protein